MKPRPTPKQETEMLVINVEIWPHGDAKRRRVLGTMTITNDGTGTDEIGNYIVMAGEQGKDIKKTKFKGFERKNGFWKLVKASLDKIIQ